MMSVPSIKNQPRFLTGKIKSDVVGVHVHMGTCLPDLSVAR